MELENQTGEIEETTTTTSIDGVSDAADESTPLLQKPESNPRARSVRTKVPEVEIRLFRRGEGPIDEFKSSLGGWDQDQLEVRDILDKYGFKSVFAFNPQMGRGVPIRFNPKNGRSLLPYTDGSVICIDGEPKDSMIKPITKILLGVVVITLMITFVMKEPPRWMKKINFSDGRVPPWVLACGVIVFTRLRKRTRNFLKNRGW
ncbi:uncharacterized protein LOC132274270 [Cornus florida]|uniref:uncharacterized protein LOC132274270 n=1 Tax=Cornus florida TaxID=4283 RepID=UPI00289CDA0F|nr:uncharacterized protein LOC132274270 [Cornus florida]